MLSLRSCFFSPGNLLALALFATAAATYANAQVSGFTAIPVTSTPSPSSSDTALAEAPAGPATSFNSARSAIVSIPAHAPAAPQDMRYGGIHEFAITAGLSRMSGHWLGYRRDVDVEVINLRYSRVIKNGRHFTASYSTEVTPYINIEEPIFNNDDTGSVQIYRKQTVGGGVTPIGFTFDFLPTHRIQPFWRCNYGVLYYHDRVLSPEGSQFMHTVDFGAGFHIYQTHTISTTVGFRYIHMSNANIAMHNPGTDAETFYIGFSRFHSPRNRNAVR